MLPRPAALAAGDPSSKKASVIGWRDVHGRKRLCPGANTVVPGLSRLPVSLQNNGISYWPVRPPDVLGRRRLCPWER